MLYSYIDTFRVKKITFSKDDLFSRQPDSTTSIKDSTPASKPSLGLISKTLKGIITGWSEGAEKIFGYKEKEMIGEHICTLFPVDRLYEELIIIEKVKKGQIVKNFETIRVRKDGSSFPVLITVTPVKNDKGEVISVQKVVVELQKK